MRMCWCTIMVKDMENSLRFYQDVLELKLRKRYTTPEGLEIVFLSDGAMSEVELIYNPHIPSYGGRGISLGFVVDSLSKSIMKMTAMGIDIIKGPIEVPSGLKFFYVHDPDGLEIQLVEMGPHSGE